MKGVGIIAFPFGEIGEKVIGRITEEIAKKLDIPVFAHEHVHLDLDIKKVTRFYEDLDNPSTTLRMVRAALRWAKENEITSLWLVAGRPHIYRCKRDLELEARDVGLGIKIFMCEEIEKYRTRMWFQSVFFEAWWLIREQILLKLPWSLYKKVAK